jgi:type I restriction enzyme M protein
LTDGGIAAVAGVFHKWESREKLSRVVTLEQVREADFNLSPSLFVETNETTAHRPLREIVNDLKRAAEERKHADEALSALLGQLRLD